MAKTWNVNYGVGAETPASTKKNTKWNINYKSDYSLDNQFSPESVVGRIDDILGKVDPISAPEFNKAQPDATYVNPNQTDMSNPIVNDIGSTIKAPFEEAAIAGQELGKGLYQMRKDTDITDVLIPAKGILNVNENVAKGGLDLAKALLHAVMLPATAPITGVTSTLREGLDFELPDPTIGRNVNIGKTAEESINQVFNLPFEAIKYGSKLASEGLKATGLNLPENEFTKSANELLIELAGLYVFKKAHEGGVKGLDKYTNIKDIPPLKVVEERINTIQKDLKQNIEVPEESKTVVGGLAKQEELAKTEKLTPTEATEPQTPVKGMEVKAEVKEPVIDPVLESKKRKEQSRLETEKLNKQFAEPDPYIEQLPIEERIQAKLDEGIKLNQEEKKYYKENQYAPEGYYYNEYENLVKDPNYKKPEVKTPVKEETKYEMRKSKGGWSVDKKENNNWGFVQQFRTKKEAQNYIDSKQKPEVSNVTKEKGRTLLVNETPETLTKEDVKSKEVVKENLPTEQPVPKALKSVAEFDSYFNKLPDEIRGKIKEDYLIDRKAIDDKFSSKNKNVKESLAQQQEMNKLSQKYIDIAKKEVENLETKPEVSNVKEEGKALLETPSKDRTVEQTGDTGTDTPVSKEIKRIISEDRKKANDDIIRKSLGQLNAGLDPKVMQALVENGLYHLENITRTGIEKGKEFAEFAKIMAKEYGDNIKPHLQDIWNNIAPKEFVPEFGEAKIRGAALSTEAKAIANDITKGFSDLPEYDVKKNKPQIDYVANLITTDIEKAKNMLFGKEELPNNLEIGILNEGLKNYAVKTKDVDLMQQIAKSPYASSIGTKAGQTVQSFRNQDPNSPVNQMQSIIKVRENAPRRQELQKIADTYEAKIKSLEDRLKAKEDIQSKKQATVTVKKLDYETRKQNRVYDKEKLRAERTVLYQDLYKELGSQLSSGIPLNEKAISIIGKLTANYVKEGITTAEGIVDAIYTELKEKIDKRTIQDAISGYGRPIGKTKSELVKQIADLRQQLSTISKIEDIELGKEPITKQVNKGKPSERLTELRAELKSKMDEAGITQEKDLAKSKEAIKKKILEYTNKIQKGDYSKEKKESILDPEKQSLQKQLDNVRSKYNNIQKNLGEVLSAEEAKTIADLYQKTADAQAKMESSPRRSTNGKPTPEEIAYGKARVEFAQYVDDLKASANKLTWENFKADKMGTLKEGIKHIPGITKSAKATLDNSGLFNQHIKTLFTHPIIWQRNARKSFLDIAHTFGGRNVLAEVSADIVSRPNYDKYIKDKLAVSVVEEAFPDSRLLEKIPYLGRIHKAADAAYTALAYRNRADLYDYYTDLARKAGIEETTGIGLGKLANSLTGRGDLGKFEKSANTVNNIFFSPRFVKSHLDVLTAHALDPNMSKFAKKQAAINLVKIIGATAGVMLTAKALGADVEEDPRSSDFGKIKIGNTRFNITGGMGSIATLASKLLSQSTKNAKGEIVPLNSGKYGSQTSWDVLNNFAQGKLAPVAGVARDVLKGQTFSGERVTVGRELNNLLTPLPVTNAMELYKDPKSAPMLGAMIADAVGIFTNTYSNDPALRSVRNTILRAEKSDLTEEQINNFNNKLNEAFVNGSITLEQAREYQQELIDLQKKR